METFNLFKKVYVLLKTFVFCGRIYIAFFWRLPSFQEELGVGVAGRARISQWPMITVDQAQKMVLDQVLKFCLCLCLQILFFLALQDSSISDNVGRSVGLSEPTNNQSLDNSSICFNRISDFSL